MRSRIRNKSKNKYIQYKSNKASSFAILCIFFISLILSIIYLRYIKQLTYKNIYKNITELSEQTTTQLNLAITDQMNMLHMMVQYIEAGHIRTEDEIFELLKGEIDNYHFTRLVILDRNGNGKTSDGFEVKDYENIDEFFVSDDVYLSENRPSTVTDDQVNIYAQVFKLNGQDRVLMATIKTSDYKEILLRRLFGKGGTYLINSNGTVLIDSFDNIKHSTTNLYEYFKVKYELTNDKQLQKIEDMTNAIKRGEIGTFDIEFGNEIYFIHYEKIAINDWYVITTASDSTIASELMNIVITSVILCLIIICIIVCNSIYINISNQKKNRQIYKVAYIDPVTLLGNETYFKGNGELYLSGHTASIKYIITVDINKFKALNRVHGYAFCNELLKVLGQKLTRLLPPDNITCRVSNDVFASIFSYDENIEELLDKIYKEASNLKVGNVNITVNLAIGAYNILPHETDVNNILDKAYLARSQIKGLYNSNYYLFDEKLEKQMIEEQSLESSMEEALVNKEFIIVYQPKVFTKNEKMAGAEALVRWKRNGEMISPGKFIPLFEKNKFIVKLDMYIFEKVCQDISDWKDKYGGAPIVSINVSKEHFVDSNFIEQYVKICEKYEIETSNIDLEITESATVDSNIDIIDIMNKIKEKGFAISIDDFGTGYSSLSMLQNMPIDILKIDKVFVDKANLEGDNNVINYIADMAEHMKVKTIVEGVETKEQVEFIKKIGCDVIQGYYYSKPIPKEEFENYFKNNM